MSTGVVLVPDSPSSVAVDAIEPRIVARRRSRVAAIDRMRLVAAALMIEGHVFTVALAPRAREARWYGWHEVVHGFTAPMFLFAAGMAFGLTSLRGTRTRGPFATHAPRFERYASLVFFGYFLHLGRTTLAELATLDVATRSRLLLVDALQCIGVTLAIAQLGVATIRSRKAFVLAMASLAIVFVVAAPWTERHFAESSGGWLDPYASHATGSLFPLFPWASYALVGILASRLLDRPGIAIARFGILGVAAIAIAVVLTATDRGFFGPHDYWRSSPYLFLGRVGVIFVVFAALSVPDRDESSANPASRPARVLQRLSGETLCLYLVHLAILYGTPVTRSVRRFVSGQLDTPGAALLFGAILIASVATALASSYVDERYPGRIDALRRFFVVAFLVRFVAAA